MAIDGGGGGGGLLGVSNSFTGPAEALEIIGNHVYCYPGEFTADTTTTTRMSFRTGNYYTVGTMRLAGYSNMGSPATGATSSAIIKLNGSVVLNMRAGYASESPFWDKAELIIPPYTEVEALTDASTTSADLDGTITFTGRIYR